MGLLGNREYSRGRDGGAKVALADDFVDVAEVFGEGDRGVA